MDQPRISTQQVTVWDLWIRLFHWTLAVCVTFLLISGTTGWQFFEWHRFVGEAVAGLLLFRLCWGIVGSDNVRLHKLMSSPLNAIKHLSALAGGRVHPERGHNAAGGWAVLTMLCLIGFQAISGLFIADEEELIEGVFYGLLPGDVSEQLLHLHHANATLLKAIVLLHVLMIVVYAIRASQNLVRPMLTGKMLWPSSSPLPAVLFQRTSVGFAVAITCLIITGFTFFWW